MLQRLAWTVLVSPLLLAALVLSACGRGGAPGSPAPYASPVRLYYDNGGGIQDSLRVVVNDAVELGHVWEAATSRQDSPPPLPAIDFDKEMLILVAAGRMTPEDQIRVDSVVATREMDAAGRMANVLNVVVRTMTGCRRFNADAYPLEIVRLRRFDGPVKFIERSSRVEGCRDPSSSGPVRQ